MLSSYKKFLILTLVVGFVQILHANQIIEIFKDYQDRTIELKQIIDEQLFSQAAPIFTSALLKAYENITDENLKLIKPLTRTERLTPIFNAKSFFLFVKKIFL